jgi:hypothetical protein
MGMHPMMVMVVVEIEIILIEDVIETTIMMVEAITKVVK